MTHSIPQWCNGTQLLDKSRSRRAYDSRFTPNKEEDMMFLFVACLFGCHISQHVGDFLVVACSWGSLTECKQLHFRFGDGRMGFEMSTIFLRVSSRGVLVSSEEGSLVR